MIQSVTWHPGIFTWPHFKEYDPGPLHGQLMPIIDSCRVKPVIQGLSEPRQRFLIAYKCLGYQLTFLGSGSTSKEGQKHF